MPLPAGYKLHPHDVVIGRGHKNNQHNDHNPIFQCLLKRYCHEYIDCTKERKSDILKEILREIKLHSTGVGFVKQMTAGPFPYAIASDAQSRTSIAQFLRNEVPENFKSSKQFKQQLRREKKVKTFPASANSSSIKVGASQVKVKASAQVPSPAPAPSVPTSNPAVKAGQPKPEAMRLSNNKILQGLRADAKSNMTSTSIPSPNDLLLLGLRSKDNHSKPPPAANSSQQAFLAALRANPSGRAHNSFSAVNALQNLAALGLPQNNVRAPAAQASNGVSASVLQSLGILQGNVQAPPPQQQLPNDILQNLGMLPANVQAPPPQQQVSNDVLQNLGILPSSVQSPPNPPQQQQVSNSTLQNLGMLQSSFEAQQQQVSNDVLQSLGILQGAAPVPQASAPQDLSAPSLMQKNPSTSPDQVLHVLKAQQQASVSGGGGMSPADTTQVLLESLVKQKGMSQHCASTPEAPKPSSSLTDEIMADLKHLDNNAVPEECSSETDSISTISGGGLGQFSPSAAALKFSFGTNDDLLSSTNLAVDLDHQQCHVGRPDSPLSIGSPFSFPSPERSDSPLGMMRAESPVIAPFAPERPVSPLDMRRHNTKSLLAASRQHWQGRRDDATGKQQSL